MSKKVLEGIGRAGEGKREGRACYSGIYGDGEGGLGR